MLHETSGSKKNSLKVIVMRYSLKELNNIGLSFRIQHSKHFNTCLMRWGIALYTISNFETRYMHILDEEVSSYNVRFYISCVSAICPFFSYGFSNMLAMVLKIGGGALSTVFDFDVCIYIYVVYFLKTVIQACIHRPIPYD